MQHGGASRLTILCTFFLSVALLGLLWSPCCGGKKPHIDKIRESTKAIWSNKTAIDKAELDRLRHAAWEMFDHGYSNYLKHASPKDNLLPISCTGQDWQGGMSLTLVDALDALLLLNRRADMQTAVELLRENLTFDKDIRVHVFETVIRVLGGLLSGHVLLTRDPSLVPGYDGLLLDTAVDLADRLLPAFDTPTGLPMLFVNLRSGKVPNDPTITCTACAGTLLLEFGLLSALTGNSEYIHHAHHCAKVMFDMRSRLGLVASSIDVLKGKWSSIEATIGPGVDSYPEYLLKAYLMFGDEEYLDMFTELYSSTMTYMQLPTTLQGYSFLVDVHFDLGRLTRQFVSSLGAFWPGMQALAGQEEGAIWLHANFTAVWQSWGWLPESFSHDGLQVAQEDPGYNLRPEHIESTYLLHSLTGDPKYLDVAAKVQRTLAAHNRATCGYAGISHVATGAHADLQESFFLSETMKYLYLTFSNQSEFINSWVLSTEGHILPVLESPPPRAAKGMCAMPAAADTVAAKSDSTPKEAGGSSLTASARQDADTAGEAGAAVAATAATGVEPTDDHLAPDAGQACEQAGDRQHSGTCSIAQPSMDAPLQAEASQSDGAGQSAQAPPLGAASAASGDAAEHGPTIGNAQAGAADLSSRASEEPDSDGGWHHPGDKVPSNCAPLCRRVPEQEQVDILAGLRAAFPLLQFNAREARLLRRRRCRACMAVTERMQAMPRLTDAQRTAMLRAGTDGMNAPKVLAQAVCVLLVKRNGRATCNLLRPVQAHDVQHGLPSNAVVLQLSLPPEGATMNGAIGPQGVTPAVVTITGGLGSSVSLQLPAAPAGFGAPLARISYQCLNHLLGLKVAFGERDIAPGTTEGSAESGTSQADGSGLAETEAKPGDRLEVGSECGHGRDVACLDMDESCSDWAERGECDANPGFMQQTCARACGLCGEAAVRKLWQERDQGEDGWQGQGADVNEGTAACSEGVAGSQEGLVSDFEASGMHVQVEQPSSRSQHQDGGRDLPPSTSTGSGSLDEPGGLLQGAGPKPDSLNLGGQPSGGSDSGVGSMVPGDPDSAAGCGGAASTEWGAGDDSLAAAEQLAQPAQAEPGAGTGNTTDNSVNSDGLATVADTEDEDEGEGEVQSQLQSPSHLVMSPALCQQALLADAYEFPEPGFSQTPEASAACDWMPWAAMCRPGEQAEWAGDHHRLVPRHVFGPCQGSKHVWGDVVAAVPLLGCSEPSNVMQLRGAVAVVARGGCSFVTKVTLMQQAGAAGVVVINNARDSGGMLVMSDVAGTAKVSIPAVMVSYGSGRLLLAALERQGGKMQLSASLSLDPSVQEEELGGDGQGEAQQTAGEGGDGSAQQCASAEADGKAGADWQGRGQQCSAEQAQAQKQSPLQQELLRIQPQIDLLIPPGTQPFLQAQVVKQGISDMNRLFQMLLEDGRASALLMSIAEGALKKSREQGQSSAPSQLVPEPKV